MTTISKDDFLSCLKASKLIDSKKLDEILADVESHDAKKIATHLVRKKILTKWQAKYLVAGHCRLHVGNYLLLERLRRDEFGDRFLAIHEQLNRQVEIQILPKSLNKNPELREAFLKSARVAAKVDHPNLVHVFDIDQEGNRFFLVVEHTKGELLRTFDPEEFSALDIAQLIKQSLQGLKAAHEKGIIHGQINKDNVIITEDEQVKIINLVMASLENPNYAHATQVEDIRAVGELGQEFLNCFNGTLVGQSELDAIISTVKSTDTSDVDALIGELDAWLDKYENSSAQSVISSNAIDLRKMTAPATTSRSDKSAAAAESKQSFLGQQNPAIVIGVAAMVCVLFLAGITWLAFSMTKDTRNVQETIAKKPNAKTMASANRDRAILDPPGKLSSPNDRLRRPEKNIALTKQEMRDALDKIGVDENSNSPDSETNEKPVDPAVDDNKVDPAESAPTIDTPQTPDPNTPPPTNQKELLPEQVAAVEPPKSADVEMAPAAAEPDKPEKTDQDFEKPFSEFPRFADLGDISDAAPHEIGKIHIPPNVLMAVEIFSGKAISKSKFLFELERSSEDKQRWIVGFKKRKASPFVKVGEFFRLDDSFGFQWDPAAANDDNHNYLRNCVLKLTGNNQQVAFLNLRSPVQIDGFAVTKEEASTEIETSIQWLPHPEHLKIEVIPMPYKGIPKSYMYPSHRQIEKRQPVLVFFTDVKNKRFFYLEVAADAKKELELKTSLMFNALDGSSPKVATPKLIQMVAQQITHLAQVTSAEYEQIKNAERPNDIKYDDFEALKKQYKKAAEMAQSQKVALLEYANIIPSLYGKNIPLRVYFEMDNMQIDIANSAPSE